MTIAADVLGATFDLSQFDDAYIRRLRERVLAAGSEGIYVSVMLFEGFGLHLSGSSRLPSA